MRISRVVIKNYRSFELFDIELKSFSLIVGENNIGKTNFLNALALVFSQEISFFKKRNLEIDDLNFNAINAFKKEIVGKKPIDEINFFEVKIEIYLTDFISNKKHSAIVADWLIDNTLEVAKLTYHYSLREDLTTWIKDIREKNKSIEEIDFPVLKYDYIIYGGLDEKKQVDYYFLKMLKFDFLDALRDAKTQLTASGDYRLLYKILTNIGDNKFDDIKKSLLFLKNTVDANTSLSELKGSISDFLQKTSLVEDDELNKVDFEFSKIEENEILKKLSLVYGDAPITVARNGLGRNNLLYISLILSHLISSNDNSNGFRIIAIEEPEAHLHPNLQEHLAKNIELLASENLQIVITSHSAHITSKLNLDNTVAFFRETNSKKLSNHYILDNFDNKKGKMDAEGKASIRYLSRFIDATKSTMFFSRKIIFVEGIAEQTLIPVFFERIYKQPLEKYGILVVNVNGVAFDHFLKVLKNGYFIKSIVITDSDSDTTQKDRANNLRDKYKDFSDVVNIINTDSQTFEIDIINSNKTCGNSRSTILKAIALTRPKSGGSDFADKFDKSLDSSSFFHLIEPKNDKGEKTGNYKSEFATNLAETLKNESNEFRIPQYIINGFSYLMKQGK